jgi:hypothetical protein
LFDFYLPFSLIVLLDNGAHSMLHFCLVSIISE